jgi:hypothetical protein
MLCIYSCKLNLANTSSDVEAEEKAEAALAWISNVPYMDHHTYAHKLRLEGTGEWLLRKPKFCQWYTAEESSVLWLCGGIGVGKTILVYELPCLFVNCPSLLTDSTAQKSSTISSRMLVMASH